MARASNKRVAQTPRKPRLVADREEKKGDKAATAAKDKAVKMMNTHIRSLSKPSHILWLHGHPHVLEDALQEVVSELRQQEADLRKRQLPAAAATVSCATDMTMPHNNYDGQSILLYRGPPVASHAFLASVLRTDDKKPVSYSHHFSRWAPRAHKLPACLAAVRVIVLWTVPPDPASLYASNSIVYSLL